MVAIIDDDRAVLNSLQDLLESAGLSARGYESAEEFLASDHRHHTACLVTDIRMPGMSGLDLQASLRAMGSRLPVIFITAVDDPGVRTQAMTAGALGFLTKPIDDEVLLELVRRALRS